MKKIEKLQVSPALGGKETTLTMVLKFLVRKSH